MDHNLHNLPTQWNNDGTNDLTWPRSVSSCMKRTVRLVTRSEASSEADSLASSGRGSEARVRVVSTTRPS